MQLDYILIHIHTLFYIENYGIGKTLVPSPYYVLKLYFSWFQCGCHKLYVCWRIFWAVYHLVWIVLTGVYSYQWAGHDPDQQIKWFIYLTDWAYFVLTFSTLIDAVCVVFISIKRDDIIQGKFNSVFNIVLLNVIYNC